VLHPDFPVINGRYEITKDWSIDLPEQFNRRIEDESLVIWRPGFTMWIIVWDNNKNEAPEARLAKFKARISERAFDLDESRDARVIFFSYRLAEASDDDSVPALNGFAIGENGHVQISIYFDQESDVAEGATIFKSLRENAAV
jgi:hypothetical protein